MAEPLTHRCALDRLRVRRRLVVEQPVADEPNRLVLVGEAGLVTERAGARYRRGGCG